MKLSRLMQLVRVAAAACVLGGTAFAGAAPLEDANYRLPVLAYHDVVASLSPADEPQTVSVDSLVRQFSELHAKGYTPVTLTQVLAASRGEQSMPARAVLLTFDDGYASFHTHVLPLLRAYHWPATLALIGTRIDSKAVDGEPAYLSTVQLRDIMGSGLVQLANHTDDLHHGIRVNSWGNAQPAAVNRAWGVAGLESDDQWAARVTADLERNRARIAELAGTSPAAMVWPYGRHNEQLQRIAASLGMPLLFTLDDGVSDVRTEHLALRRYLVGRDDREGAIVAVTSGVAPAAPIVRAVSVRIEELAAHASASDEPGLSAALSTLTQMQGNVVVLDPFVRQGRQVVGTTFPTATLSVGFNYANRVAALATGKAGYASWLSVPLAPQRYGTLTQEQVLDTLEDAAKSTPISGLLVEDADQVDPAVLQAALQRVRRWRGGAVLTLGFDHAPSSGQVTALVTASQAGFVWLDGAWPMPAKFAPVPVIHVFGAGAAVAAHAEARNGVAHLAVTALPAQAAAWTEFFSLKAMPARRIVTGTLR